MQLLLNLVAHLVAGFLLMFVAHFGGFLGSGLGLPYWWAYLLLYPIATVVSVRRLYLSPLLAAASLCMAPMVYFIAIGKTSHHWNASGSAIGGAIAAFIVSFLLATWSQRWGQTPRV